jgi:hypothetical protein
MRDRLGNYEPNESLPKRTGPGEGGALLDLYRYQMNSCLISGVPVSYGADEEQAVQNSIARYGFNMVVSDKISMDRQIKDTRPDEYVQTN